MRYVDSSSGKPSFWRQYILLVKRDVAMAARDPAMYYLQFLMNLVLGLFIGAVFFKIIEYEEKLLIIVSGSIVWITFTVAYIQVFKVCTYVRAVPRTSPCVAACQGQLLQHNTSPPNHFLNRLGILPQQSKCTIPS